MPHQQKPKDELEPRYWIWSRDYGWCSGPFDTYDEALEAAESILKMDPEESYLDIYSRFFRVSSGRSGPITAPIIAGPGQLVVAE